MERNPQQLKDLNGLQFELDIGLGHINLMEMR